MYKYNTFVTLADSSIESPEIFSKVEICLQIVELITNDCVFPTWIVLVTFGLLERCSYHLGYTDTGIGYWILKKQTCFHLSVYTCFGQLFLDPFFSAAYKTSTSWIKLYYSNLFILLNVEKLYILKFFGNRILR